MLLGEVDEKKIRISRIYEEEVGRIVSPRGAFLDSLVQCITRSFSEPLFSYIF